MMFNINSLKFKISITAFLLLTLIMVVTTWRDVRLTENKLINSQKEKATLLSDRIAHGIMVLMLKNRWKELQGMMETIVADGDELKEIRIFLPEDGTIVFSSDSEDVGKKIYKEDLDRYLEGNHSAAFLIDKEGERYASKLTLIKNQTECHRCHGTQRDVLGVMDLELSLSKINSAITQFKKEH